MSLNDVGSWTTKLYHLSASHLNASTEVNLSPKFYSKFSRLKEVISHPSITQTD